MRKPSYVQWQQSSRVKGIPCLVNVLTFQRIPPDHRTWASDIDYRGGYVIEFEVMDRKGYKANWLTKKMTDEDFDRIEQEIIEEYKRG